jgi:hypothetical protein
LVLPYDGDALAEALSVFGIELKREISLEDKDEASERCAAKAETAIKEVDKIEDADATDDEREEDIIPREPCHSPARCDHRRAFGERSAAAHALGLNLLCRAKDANHRPGFASQS